ncbi:MAG TPA: hypothetical protein VGG72_22445 [Bryobacteraceae bacterium]|jgi:hypothetical protein
MVIGGLDASVSVVEGDAAVRRTLLEAPEIQRNSQDDPSLAL